MYRKELSFYFKLSFLFHIKLSWKCFFMRKFKWKTFTNCNFADLTMSTLCIQHLNLYWIKTNLAGWQLLIVHNYTFKFSPFYFFRLNWVGCLFHCNTGTLTKLSFLYIPFSISLKLVVGTCMDRATPVYNEKKNIQSIVLKLFFHRIWNMT